MKVNDIVKVCNILKEYNGDNNQILYYKCLVTQKKYILSEFDIKYIKKNKNYSRKTINKTVKISSDMGKYLQNKYKVEFIPQKIYIGDIIGELNNLYHCYAKFRQSMPLQLMFIDKKYILEPLESVDIEKLLINFEKYDKLTETDGRKLKEHQKTAVKFLLANKKCILADSQGLGKTASAIVAALEGDFKKILVITTKSLKTNWRRELVFYVNTDDICIIEGSKWVYDKKFTIINYDIVQNFYQTSSKSVKNKKNGENDDIKDTISKNQLFESNFDCVIIDEVQKLSNNSSIRYKTINSFLKKSKPYAVFLLTGTPLTNRPMNLYNILKLIDADITKDYLYYCKRYCEGREITLKNTGKKIMLSNGASNLDELKEKIKHLYIRRLQSEIPEMVKKDIYTKYYDLNERQREEYNKLWKEYVDAQEAQGNLDSKKYRQLVEGILVRQYLAKEMVGNTVDMVNDKIEYGEKVIIVCTFQEEINEFKKIYGEKAVVYDGKMSTRQKDSAVKAFMENPAVIVFIGQIVAFGVGLNLTVSNYLIFNSYSWAAADNLQSMDRIYRLTQTRDVSCIYQLFTDSISQHMFEKVMKKEIIMNEIIKSEKEK